MLTITSPPLKGVGGCLYNKLSITKNNYAKNRNP